MKAATEDTRAEPIWVGDALIVRCGQCFGHPGSKYDDGSGGCPSCLGSGWIVLAQELSQARSWGTTMKPEDLDKPGFGLAEEPTAEIHDPYPTLP